MAGRSVKELAYPSVLNSLNWFIDLKKKVKLRSSLGWTPNKPFFFSKWAVFSFQIPCKNIQHLNLLDKLLCILLQQLQSDRFVERAHVEMDVFGWNKNNECHFWIIFIAATTPFECKSISSNLMRKKAQKLERYWQAFMITFYECFR